MKTILFAALAVLLLASSGHSQTGGNCFRVTTAEEQEAGLPTFAPSDYCISQENGPCFRQEGVGTVHPDYTGYVKFVPVDFCDKYDLFDEARP